MTSGVTRVTIVAPRGRVDVSLPADVPLVDLLPSLLDLAGGATEESGRRDGWALSRLGGGELDSSHTAVELSVRDGELLYLRPRGGADSQVTVFDDLVDALASGKRDGLGRWKPASSRLAGLVAAVLVLAAGAVSLLFTGPPHVVAGLTGLGLTALLLAVSVVFARALGWGRAGTTFALLAAAYAGVGGLLVVAGDRALGQLTVAHVTVAATAVVVTAAVAAVAVPVAAPLFLCAGVCAAAVPATMALATALGTGLSGAAAATVVVAYATLPAMPMFAYRMAGLPRAVVPTERADLKEDIETVDGPRVLELGRRADAFLAAMLGALALISAAAAVLVAGAGLPGLALAGVLGVLPVLRSRWFWGWAQRLPLLLAGGIGLMATALALLARADHQGRLLAIGATGLAVCLLCVSVALAGDRPASPRWGRFLDIIEILLILALAPLAVWVSGILGVVRAIRG